MIATSMAEPGSEKFIRDAEIKDQAVGGTANHEEPTDSDSEGKGKFHEITTNNSKQDEEGNDGDGKGREALARAKSYATTTSAFSRTEDVVVEKKPWYKKTNPLKWGAPPPVPETRGVSREYTASFVSQLYFQWMAPMMSVRNPNPPSI